MQTSSKSQQCLYSGCSTVFVHSHCLWPSHKRIHHS